MESFNTIREIHLYFIREVRLESKGLPLEQGQALLVCIPKEGDEGFLGVLEKAIIPIMNLVIVGAEKDEVLLCLDLPKIGELADLVSNNTDHEPCNSWGKKR